MPKLGLIKDQSIYVTQRDQEFDGSNYQDDDFVLVLHSGIRATIANEIGRRNAAKEWEALGFDGDVSNVIVGKHIILAIIDTWQGFIGLDSEEMDCTLENKSAMYDYDSKLFEGIYKSYMRQVEPEKQEEDVLDNAMGKQEDILDGNIQNLEEVQEAPIAEHVETQ